MISALVSGQLVRAPKSGTSASGTRWCNTTIRCAAGQDKDGATVSAFVTVLAFGDVADQLARLEKGDTVSAQGPLRPTEYQTKDGETRHGLEIIANALLTPYQLRKWRGDADRAPAGKSARSAPDSWAVYDRASGQDFNDDPSF